jgi:LEA14-like dessication related protein
MLQRFSDSDDLTIAARRRLLLPVLTILAACMLVLSGCGDFKEVQISQISGVKVLNVSDKGIELELGMKIKNPNAWAFTIYRSAFHVNLGETDLGIAQLTHKERVAANSEEVHTFHISTTFDKIAQGGMGNLIALFAARKNPEIQIKGNLKVGKFLIRKSIPIDKKQRVNLDTKDLGSLFSR